MSSRKSSMKIDRIHDFLQNNGRSIELTRTRKNSMGVNRPCLEQIHSNINFTLDEKLTQKLMFVKRIQKIQKDAIKLFYEQRGDECFELLEKALNLLEQKSIPAMTTSQDNKYPQHLVYIRYLQCEFKFKLKLYDQSREYYEKVSKVISKLSKAQKQKTKQYLMSLQALNCCLLFEEGKFTESVRCVQQFQVKIQENQHKISEKLLKQVSMCRIQSLIQINEFKLAIKLIEKFIGRHENLSLRQRWKLNSMLALSFHKLGEIEEAQKIMEELVENFKKQDSIYDSLSKYKTQEKCNQSKAYLSKSYASYVEMFWQQPVKVLFLAKRWSEDCQSSDHAKIKLFHLYYEMGDYEQALIEFSQISQNYKKTAQDWQSLAQIKYFYGELETAKHIFHKALEIAKNEQLKLTLQVRLLQFEGEQNGKDHLRKIEKRIKDNRSRNWIHKVVQKYGEYLYTIGEQQRIQKINKIMGIESEKGNKINTTMYAGDNFLQTGKFGDVSVKKQENEKESIQRNRNSFIPSKLL